jgi:hypothetical protein
MTKTAAIGALVMASTACAIVPPPEPEVPVHGDVGGSCNARAAQGLVGRPTDNNLGFEAQRLTGARTLRWIRPGDMVTMEFSPSRLNIHLDERHRVSRLVCG